MSDLENYSLLLSVHSFVTEQKMSLISSVTQTHLILNHELRISRYKNTKTVQFNLTFEASIIIYLYDYMIMIMIKIE